jgi:ubiquinone/menaquinone biosynthesis C-methylase UbiE
VSERVVNFYREFDAGEWDRLEQNVQKVEFLSTLRLIDSYMPESGVACDIGAGPGRYSLELLRKGFRVTLFDASENLLKIAREKIGHAGLTADAYHIGDARDLSIFEDETFDLILVMGPLYHLDETDRPGVLQDVRRLLKAEGRALLAYLNGWGLLRTGVFDFARHLASTDFVESLRAQNGVLDIWHWTNPLLARQEIEQAGLHIEAYAGMEGFLGGMKTPVANLAAEHPDTYETLVSAAVQSSELPQYRDATDHLNFVVSKA